MTIEISGVTARRRSVSGRVGVVPVLDANAGGTHQYSISLLEALAALMLRPPTILLVGPAASSAETLNVAGYPLVPLEPPSQGRGFRRAVARMLGHETARRLTSVVRRFGSIPGSRFGGLLDHSARSSRIAPWLRLNGIDFVILPWPELLVIDSGVPFVLAVHDLQHRLQPEFPEVSADGEWEARERLFRVGIERALLVLVDSEVGREDVLTHYGDVIEADRVKVLPFLPAPYLDRAIPADAIDEVRIRHRLPDRFLFFPAQFWSHKNHVRVVQAIGRLRSERGLDVPVVMCGSAEGNLREAVLGQVLTEAGAAGVADLVRILGHVPDSDMGALYRASTGVLLPTFFGPTNIPVLEGWAMGIPVLTSDIRGIREQCGDAAVLVDPRSVDAIADGMAALWRNEPLRSRLVCAGTARLQAYGPRDFRHRLHDILEEAERRLSAASNLGI